MLKRTGFILDMYSDVYDNSNVNTDTAEVRTKIVCNNLIEHIVVEI